MIPISFLLLYNNIWEEVYENIFNIRCWWQCIKYALMQEDLTILEKSSVPTPMDTLENFIETIGKIYDQFQDQINGMALSMPGIIDLERGYQYTGGALRYIDKLETVEVLKKALSNKYYNW